MVDAVKHSVRSISVTTSVNKNEIRMVLGIRGFRSIDVVSDKNSVGRKNVECERNEKR
jgi:hypothetical protein